MVAITTRSQKQIVATAKGIRTSEGKLEAKLQTLFEEVVSHSLQHKCPELATNTVKALFGTDAEGALLKSRSAKFKAYKAALEAVLPVSWSNAKHHYFKAKDKAWSVLDGSFTMPSIWDTAPNDKPQLTPTEKAINKAKTFANAMSKASKDSAVELPVEIVKAMNLLNEWIEADKAKPVQVNTTTAPAKVTTPATKATKTAATV